MWGGLAVAAATLLLAVALAGAEQGPVPTFRTTVPGVAGELHGGDEAAAMSRLLQWSRAPMHAAVHPLLELSLEHTPPPGTGSGARARAANSLVVAAPQSAYQCVVSAPRAPTTHVGRPNTTQSIGERLRTYFAEWCLSRALGYWVVVLCPFRDVSLRHYQLDAHRAHAEPWQQSSPHGPYSVFRLQLGWHDTLSDQLKRVRASSVPVEWPVQSPRPAPGMSMLDRQDPNLPVFVQKYKDGSSCLEGGAPLTATVKYYCHPLAAQHGAPQANMHQNADTQHIQTPGLLLPPLSATSGVSQDPRHNGQIRVLAHEFQSLAASGRTVPGPGPAFNYIARVDRTGACSYRIAVLTDTLCSLLSIQRPERDIQHAQCTRMPLHRPGPATLDGK